MKKIYLLITITGGIASIQQSKGTANDGLLLMMAVVIILLLIAGLLKAGEFLHRNRRKLFNGLRIVLNKILTFMKRIRMRFHQHLAGPPPVSFQQGQKI